MVKYLFFFTWIKKNHLYSMKHSAFLAYDVLNSDTSNNINNEIAKYMNDTTEAIFRDSKREKRGLQNEPHKGKKNMFSIHTCAKLL